MTRTTRPLTAALLAALAIPAAALAQPPAALPPVPQPVAVGLSEPPPPPPGVTSHGTVYAHDEKTCGDLLIDGEYLLLAPRRPGQTYAVVGTNPFWGPVGTIKSVDGGYDSGLRVGAGWRFADGGWDVMGRYAYFHSSADDVATRPAGGQVFATLTHPSTVVEVGGAYAQSSVNFNVFDLEIGKRFELGESANARVFAGPRYANVDQALNVTYAGGDVVTDRVHRCTCFDGAGLRAGGEANWRFLDHLGLYLRGSASLLTGRFHSCKFEEANGFPIVDVAERYTRVVPMVDMGVGLSFQKGNWRVSAGYEFINWFNMVDASDFVDDAHPAKLIRSVGNLGFDGVVFRAELSF
ncbi:MAG: Lpg1974 family pore-forming outer membrane protein [Gemmataceae bacterium]